MTTVATVNGTTASTSSSQPSPQNKKRKEGTPPTNGTLYSNNNNNNNNNSKKKKRRKKAQRVEIPFSNQQQRAAAMAILKAPNAADPGEPSMEVRTISPTVRGVVEAARVLREGPVAETVAGSSLSDSPTPSGPSGILSFPTETVYTMCSTVRINGSASNSTTLGQLQRLKQHESGANKKVGSKDPPLVYVASALHARQFVEFSKPKVYVLTKPKEEDGNKTLVTEAQKEGSTDLTSDDDASSFSSSDSVTTPSQKALSTSPQTASAVVEKASTAATPTATASHSLPSTPATCVVGRNDANSTAKLPAARFSESREVLNRISNVVWPGPTVIYAPAKLDSTSVAAAISGSGEPILPESVLVDFTLKEDNDTGQPRKFVGMRCPSHPLAQRVLAEVYGTANVASASASCSNLSAPPLTSPIANTGSTPVGNPHMPRSFASDVAVIGYNAAIGSGVDAVAAPTSAKEVCSVLLQHQNKPQSPSSPVPPVVHVLNGEDRREIFSVPTCQHGSGSTTSIVIDDIRREVRIVRPPGQEQATRRENGGVSNAELLWALYRPTCTSSHSSASHSRTTFPPSIPSLTPSKPSGSGETARRVVTAVLRRWKVVEQEA